MDVGIELDTEKSNRKYQVYIPVAPQRNRNRSHSVAVFRVLTGFLYHYMYNCLYNSCDFGRKIPDF